MQPNRKSPEPRPSRNSSSGASKGVQRGPSFRLNLQLDDDTWNEVLAWAAARNICFAEAARCLIVEGLQSLEDTE